MSIMHRAVEETSLPRQHSGWRWWLGWLVLIPTSGVIGMLVGVLASCATLGVLSDWLASDTGFSAVILSIVVQVELAAATGCAVGIAQQIKLDQYFLAGRLRGWILLTSVGAAIGVVAFNLPQLVQVSAVHPFVTSLLFGALAGLILGCAQWLVLRNCVASAKWLIPLNSLSWSMGSLGSAILANMWSESGDHWPLPRPLDVIKFFANPTLGLFIFAGITGLGLIWLIRTSPNVHSLSSDMPSPPPHTASPN